MKRLDEWQKGSFMFFRVSKKLIDTKIDDFRYLYKFLLSQNYLSKFLIQSVSTYILVKIKVLFYINYYYI